MVKNNRSPRPSLALRLALLQVVVVALGVLIAQAVTWLLLPMLIGPLLFPLAVVLVTVIAALAGGGAGYLISRRTQRRLMDLTAVVEAWLRGNLNLRIHDPTDDTLGVLARRLDAVAEHLEEDEEDLDRLRESNIRLTDQVRALAVVEERNRLARELHDTVKQHLFSLAMTASAVRMQLEMQQSKTTGNKPGNPEALTADRCRELEQMIREIETEAQAAQRETTRLIQDLRPVSLSERGLADALNDYTLLFGAQEHLLIYLDVQCKDQTMSPSITEALYRVAQEALHNVAHHAHATHVDVGLRCADHRIILTVEDNGIGFDTHRARPGMGISNMQERMLAVGGRLRVQSAPGAGTTVEAEVEVMPAGAGTAPAGGGQHIVRPRTEAWGWLGQKLTIPVGQMWPWLPADQERHLRNPEIGPVTLRLKRDMRLLGLIQSYSLWSEKQKTLLVRIQPERNGYSWDLEYASWRLRNIRSLKGRAILERSDQPLAAMQYRGREMDTWTDIIYDDCFYRIAFSEGKSPGFKLIHEDDTLLMRIEGDEIRLHRSLPLPLIAAVTARVLDEGTVRQAISMRKRDTDSSMPPDSADRDEVLRFELRKELRALVRDVADKVPPDVLARVEALERSLLALLPHIEHLSGGDHDAYTIRQTIRDYLPSALDDYRALPAAFAADHPIQEGKTAREHLLRQLDLLQQATDDIAVHIPHESVQRLLSHGRFLERKFENSQQESPLRLEHDEERQ